MLICIKLTASVCIFLEQFLIYTQDQRWELIKLLKYSIFFNEQLKNEITCSIDVYEHWTMSTKNLNNGRLKSGTQLEGSYNIYDENWTLKNIINFFFITFDMQIMEYITCSVEWNDACCMLFVLLCRKKLQIKNFHQQNAWSHSSKLQWLWLMCSAHSILNLRESWNKCVFFLSIKKMQWNHPFTVWGKCKLYFVLSYFVKKISNWRKLRLKLIIKMV